MTVAARLGELQQRYDQIERAADFVAIARLLLAGRGQFHVSRDIARTAPRISERVRRIMSAPEAPDLFVRAAVLPSTLGGTPALSDFRIAVSGFAASLANVGIFDRLLGGGFRRVPLGLLSTGAVNVGAVGVVVDEASAKPVSSLSLSSAAATVRKATSLLILTSELARATEGDIDGLIAQELRVACIRAIDQKTIQIATSGAPSATASGTNLAAFYGDLAFALNAVSIDQSSRLFIVMTSSVAKQLSLMLSQGAASSTSMSPSGGQIAGIEVLTSDALLPGQMVILDSNAFAAAASDLTLSTLAHGSVQLDTSPDSPATSATNLQSLWQLNQIGLLAERFWILERLRSASAAVITGASYASGFSP